MFRVMNTLQPGSVAKVKKPFTKESQLENINAFLSAVKAYGVPEDKCFAPEDLNTGSNIPNVINCILALGRQVREDFLSFFLSKNQTFSNPLTNFLDLH